MNMTTASLNPSTATERTVWRIDADHTEVGFEVKHLMISKVRGRFVEVKGTIELDAGDLTRSAVHVEIVAASVDTGQTQRDDHLRSADFFDVERFPSLTFRGTRIQRGSAGFELFGDLTIRDVTREVVLHVTEEGEGTDPWGARRIAFSATTRIDRSAFGLTWNQALETGGVLVGNEIKITLDVQAIRAD
jgi:polyisoprenoid-binding protein YceI